MKKEVFAYVAGLLDGEASFSIWHRQYKATSTHGRVTYSNIRVGMTDEKVILWLKENFGGCITHMKPVGNRKDAWVWSIFNKRDVNNLLKKLLPFLRVKKRPAEIMIKFNNTFHPSNYIVGKGTRIKDDVWKRRVELIHELSLLNAKGRKPRSNPYKN